MFTQKPQKYVGGWHVLLLPQGQGRLQRKTPIGTEENENYDTEARLKNITFCVKICSGQFRERFC